VEISKEFADDVFETVKRIHGETDLMAVFVETAEEIGGFDNKYLLFKRFLIASWSPSSQRYASLRWATRTTRTMSRLSSMVKRTRY